MKNKEPLVVPILRTVDPALEDANTEFVNATAPTPDDAKTTHQEYRISRNDLLSIGITDLVGPGQETVQTRRVSENGMISLPYIGAMRADGMTEIELEQAIAQAYRDAQLIQNANVSVTVVEARGRSFEVLGAVARPNIYAIPEADFRLLDALVMGGDVTSPQIDYIYVIRKTEPEAPPATRPVIRRQTPPGPTTAPTSAPAPGDLAPRGQLMPAEQKPEARSQEPVGSLQSQIANGNSQMPSGEHALNLLADEQAGETPTIANAALSTGHSQPLPAPAPAAPVRPLLAQESVSPPSGGFEFNQPPLPAHTRIIRIPYQALRNGDLNYNIAIRPHDVVMVQPLPVGVYYVYGHVARPGVFTLAGQKVTIKQAIGGAGMFDELAIPQRAEIIRRIRPNHEVFVRLDLDKIFAGEEPDIYLKPDDQINVGTNAIAPFLAALRGAFRITYGFGFLYDRNFAYNNFAGGF